MVVSAAVDASFPLCMCVKRPIRLDRQSQQHNSKLICAPAHLQKLALAEPRIADKQRIDVASDGDLQVHMESKLSPLRGQYSGGYTKLLQSGGQISARTH